jgi:energy-coupling factor transport system ATP-binding protein
MDKGKVAMSGTPAEIFSRVSELQELRLTVPQATELAHRLKMAGVPIRDGILTGGELVSAIMKLWLEVG